MHYYLMVLVNIININILLIEKILFKKCYLMLLLKGLAQFFRSNTAEATKYLNCALRSKRSNAWVALLL